MGEKLRHSDKFRDYQSETLDKLRAYREAYLTNETNGAALVCHPTGTGKTVVIAGYSQCLSEVGTCLILTTRTAIRDQLARELGGNLYLDPDKFALAAINMPEKPVYLIKAGADLRASAGGIQRRAINLVPDTLRNELILRTKPTEGSGDSVLDWLENNSGVLIMTVSLLQTLKRNDPIRYETLRSRIDTVIFDEGHYEPAASWSETIRALAAPTVLFTATPFRNDLRPFEIRRENIALLTYETASSQGHVRKVKVHGRQPLRSADRFCQDTLDFCEEMYGLSHEDWPRIIIHADTAPKIERLAKAFMERGMAVVAIHDTFSESASTPWKKKAVPLPQNTAAQVWIHQYKLIEGIDDHRFCVLAFFDPLSNARSVIQQTGRIIRTAPGERQKTAHVLDHFGGRIGQLWERFIDYDKGLTPDLLAQNVTKYYIERVREVLPDVEYINRSFRRKLQLESVENPVDEFLFDRRVTLRRTTKDFSFETLVSEMEVQLDDGETLYERVYEGDDMAILVYARASTPEFLNTTYFIEIVNGARAIIALPDARLVAIADTSGTAPGLSDTTGLSRVAREDLQRLISPGAVGRISAVSSLNTNLGNRVVRRRSISAPSIGAIPPGLDEHGHVLSNMTGFNGDRPRIVDDLDVVEIETVPLDAVEDQDLVAPGEVPAGDGSTPDIIRRYIGLTNATISEAGEKLRLKALKAWVESLSEQMSAGTQTPGVFHRYATEEPGRIRNGLARNILVDLFEAMDHYTFVSPGKANVPLETDDLCVNRTGVETVKRDGETIQVSRFTIKLNQVDYPLGVSFNIKSQRYRLDSSEIDAAYSAEGALKDMPLCRFLNQKQAFNIIPDAPGLIYVHGRFYRPGLATGEAFDPDRFHVGHCLYPSRTFKNAALEKGSKVLGAGSDGVGKNYDPDALFGIIDGWGAGIDTNTFGMPREWLKAYHPPRITFTPSLIICDDMGNEISDFILADEGEHPRVVFVHAKASRAYAPTSASAIQEVCAQAQKNTGPLSLFTLQVPPNLSRWDRPHSFAGAKKEQFKVANRIRKPEGLAGADAWARLERLLRNPQTDREIWLVLGNMMSASAFDKAFRKDDVPPEALQMYHLMETTLAAAGQLAAKLRVFCAP